MAAATLDQVKREIEEVENLVRHQPAPDAVLKGEWVSIARSAEDSIQRWVDVVDRIVRDVADLFELSQRVQEVVELARSGGNEEQIARVMRLWEDWLAVVKRHWNMAQNALLDLKEFDDGILEFDNWEGTPANWSTLGELRETVADIMRAIRLTCPEVDLEVKEAAIEDYSTIRIPPLGYLKSVWAVFWNAVRHPFTETDINLYTGEVMARE
jgi:hypothetical protein